MPEAIGAIFDLDMAISKTRKALGTRNNVYLDTMDWKPWILFELDCIFGNGTCTLKEEQEAQLGNLGFPAKALDHAKLVMRTELDDMIRQALGPVRDSHHYEYEFLDGGPNGLVYNLKIVDKGNKRVLEAERILLEQELFEESGGYIPERMR